MSENHFTDQTLFELATATFETIPPWRKEWLRLFERYSELENKFEAMTKEGGEVPDDIPKLCCELSELTGDSVMYRYWQHVNDGVPGSAVHELYVSKLNRHTGEKKTLSEAVSTFRDFFKDEAKETAQ